MDADPGQGGLELISSRRNPLVGRLRALHQGRGRREQQRLLLEGTHLLQEVLRLGLRPDWLLATAPWMERHGALLAQLRQTALQVASPSGWDSALQLRVVSEAVLAALDDGLRAEDHEWINRAGILAGAVHAVEALPTLIFAQVAQSAPSERGDRAWIATGRTISYVANVIPVVGDNAGAYQPVIGQLIEGVVLRVQDCAVTIYHGGVHDSLVAMAAYDSGMDVSSLGWDIRAWHRWFNEEYVPFKRRQDEELAKAAAQVP